MFNIQLLAHQQTFNQNKDQESSAISYLIDPILINSNNNKLSSSPQSLKKDSMELTLINKEDTFRNKLVNRKTHVSNAYNIELSHKELDQSAHHGNNYEKEFQLENFIHQEYLLSPSELKNYNFGSSSQIYKSLNLEDPEYFSQQIVVPQEDALITLPDEIFDKLQPLEENIPVTNLEIINNLQPKEY
ncbi:hypothetical protein O181_128567 [Austropuccinia psidii MF-1]|uniref:Uncharacterized protein n=1 Tax=Austropuccinia psidii MF-1 TaxID=1389203 RepID=A0A9Q3KXJ2_9BASI|nr:hypothetical protein [Austropuccinia psidii MF-1]